jgi:hypothetical protein
MGSGGPKTARGKAIVARNAISHGVLAQVPVVPGFESGTEWESFRAGVVANLKPTGMLEKELGERIAVILWRLRRINRYETEELALLQEAVETDWAKQHGGDGRRFALRSSDPVAIQNGPQTFAENTERLRRFPSLPDNAPLTEVDAGMIFWAVASSLDLDRYKFLAQDLPVDEEGGPPVPKRWTAGRVRQQIAALGFEPAEVMEAAIAHWTQRMVPRAVADAKQVTQDLWRMRRERMLPDDLVLGRIMRYEAHLNRQLMAALSALEALRERRVDEAALAPLEAKAVS